MNDALKLHLMREAMEEAHKSHAEDDRNHPRVGAVLADEDGNILLRAHRGENESGGHAEFLLFQKAENEGIDLRDKTLFVTLEPCTRRGTGKIPCAVRVGNSGIKRVYIGTIDPNPSICGRGELHLLNQGLEVERFPFSLTKEILRSNKAFFDDYAHYSAPVVAIDDENRGSGISRLPGNREAILQASLELIITSKGPIHIFSGGSSWVRELQVGLLYASLEHREIRVLCEHEDETDMPFEMRKSAARATGATVATTKNNIGIRGTLASANTEKATLISIERSPTLHGLKLSSPHETGVLAALTTFFDQEWSRARHEAARVPSIKPIDIQYVENVLRREIPAYKNAKFRLEEIEIDQLRFLSKNMERFKLFRIGILEALLAKHNFPTMGFFEGSPWPYLLPIVERSHDGKYTVIDGAHRVYHAMQKDKKLLPIILVDGVDYELPADPIENLDEVRVTSDKWPRARRYNNFKPNLFRDVRNAIERDLWASSKIQN
ncbi:deaminase [Tardiphaga sp. 619_E2_N8_5]|uniref:deaminase n=1 Tax=unclassified Tardiphaga TaxID=2631404 RepID=UPI003F1E9DDE